MKIIHISYGGPDRQIRDATGKVWRFEMHPHFGPAAQDAKGELLEILPKGTHGDGVLQESLMYLEIDRCANNAELGVLTHELTQVLAEVRVAVADFEPMKAKLRDLLQLVEQTPYAAVAGEKAEVKSFLEEKVKF